MLVGADGIARHHLRFRRYRYILMNMKSKITMKTTPKSRKVKPLTGKYEISVSVLILQEGDYYVAYSPALELSSYGKSVVEAKKSFAQVLKIFVEETERKGTFEKVLLGLGWTLQQKPSFKYQPPELSLRERRALERKTVGVQRKTLPVPYATA